MSDDVSKNVQEKSPSGKLEEPLNCSAERWVRPLSHNEDFFSLSCHFKCVNTVQAVWLATEQPLDGELVRTALGHLTRRVTVLNMCIRHRGLKLWYKMMSEQKIDFDIVDEEPMRLLKDMLDKNYSTREGPLWYARMIRLSSNQESLRGVRAENHTVVLFGVNHVISDGFTNHLICKELIDILNKLVKMEPIQQKVFNLSKSYAEMNVDFHKIEMFSCFKRWFMSGLTQKITFGGLMPSSSNYNEVSTKILFHVFPEDITQTLIARCKENNTTVHSCIVTTLNISYWKIIRKRSGKGQEIEILHSDSVDLRRYYPQQELEHVGCHAAVMIGGSTICEKDVPQFWDTARAAKKKLHDELESREWLKFIPSFKTGLLLSPINMLRNKLKATNLIECHYCTSNLGDVSEKFGEMKPDDPVKLTDTFRSANCTVLGVLPYLINMQTFRKRLYISLDYSNNKISDEIVNEIFTELKINLTNLAETGMINWK